MSHPEPRPNLRQQPERPVVVGLVRVSSEAQAADGRAGLQRQRDVIERTTRTKNLDIRRTYELTDVSGTTTGSHPVIREILKQIIDGQINGIVVADLDRLFRPDRPENYAVLQTFQDMGAKIYTGDSEFDLRTKDGLLFGSIRAAIAGFELGLMKERQQGAIETKRRAGKAPTSEITFPTGIGYDRKTETWTHTPEIHKVIELFRLYDEVGVHNYCELGRRVGFNNNTVKSILRNPIYTGWRVITKKRGAKRVSKNGKTYQQKILRAEADQIRVKVLPEVVSEECFARVQASMEKARFNHCETKLKDHAINLGQGIAVCANCGQPLFPISGKKAQGKRSKKEGYYQCSANHTTKKAKLGGCKQPNIKNSELDDTILSLTSKVLQDRKWLAWILAASHAKRNAVITPFAPSASPSALVKELNKKLDRLVLAYQDGVIGLPELKLRRKPIEQEIENALKLAEPKTAPDQDDFLLMARLLVKGAANFHKVTDKKVQKETVDKLFDEIHVRGKTIIGFRFAPSALPQVAGVTQPELEILLPESLPVGTPTADVPKGHRLCIKCGNVKPETEFYTYKHGTINRCTPCRTAQDREATRRRRAARAAAANEETCNISQIEIEEHRKEIKPS